jgi:hypothetical protein
MLNFQKHFKFHKKVSKSWRLRTTALLRIDVFVTIDVAEVGDVCRLVRLPDIAVVDSGNTPGDKRKFPATKSGRTKSGKTG